MVDEGGATEVGVVVGGGPGSVDNVPVLDVPGASVEEPPNPTKNSNSRNSAIRNIKNHSKKRRRRFSSCSCSWTSLNSGQPILYTAL